MMDKDKQMEKLIRAVAKNKIITNEFSIETLAKLLNINPQTFDKQIRKELK